MSFADDIQRIAHPGHASFQIGKCPPADANVRSAMETKMAASWEYDEYNLYYSS
jgi:hypothetical protein